VDHSHVAPSAGVPLPSTPPLVGTGEWPAVPPAPAPIKPPSPTITPEPPLLLGSTAILARLAANAPATSDDDSPTAALPAARPLTPRKSTRGPALKAEDSPILQLQRSLRREQAMARATRQDLVWQPRFALMSGLVILLALAAVTLPLWIVLYRSISPDNGGPQVAGLAALAMMLLGGFLAGAAAWVIIIEMRGRVRMVDTLARTGEREALIAPEPEVSLESIGLHTDTTGAPTSIPSHIVARAETQQASAAAMLEASSKLLSSFSAVLKSFGQLPAQVALLAVALALFVGATILSLH
jgi:hypothetical protein